MRSLFIVTICYTILFIKREILFFANFYLEMKQLDLSQFEFTFLCFLSRPFSRINTISVYIYKSLVLLPVIVERGYDNSTIIVKMDSLRVYKGTFD